MSEQQRTELAGRVAAAAAGRATDDAQQADRGTDWNSGGLPALPRSLDLASSGRRKASRRSGGQWSGSATVTG
jgi:hypothetical protein